MSRLRRKKLSLRIDCLNQHALIHFSVGIVSHFHIAVRTFIARHIIKVTTHSETKRLA